MRSQATPHLTPSQRALLVALLYAEDVTSGSRRSRPDSRWIYMGDMGEFRWFLQRGGSKYHPPVLAALIRANLAERSVCPNLREYRCRLTPAGRQMAKELVAAAEKSGEAHSWPEGWRTKAG